MAARGRPPGQPKSGGRVRGSLDKGERQLVTAEMAADILKVYERLGGVDFLYRWAKTNPTAYVSGVLSKLMPAAPTKDSDSDTVNNVQVNIGHLSDIEIAMRIAFALNKGLIAKRQLEANKDALL